MMHRRTFNFLAFWIFVGLVIAAPLAVGYMIGYADGVAQFCDPDEEATEIVVVPRTLTPLRLVAQWRV